MAGLGTRRAGFRWVPGVTPLPELSPDCTVYRYTGLRTGTTPTKQPNPRLGFARNPSVYRYTSPVPVQPSARTGTAINPVPVRSPAEATRELTKNSTFRILVLGFKPLISGFEPWVGTLSTTLHKTYLLIGYSVEDEPKVGMTFISEEEAYNFYNAYARKIGFSIRKSHTTRRKDNTVQTKWLVCSRQGKREDHPTYEAKRPRRIERVDCQARIEFKIDRSNAWTIKRVILDHSHKCTSPGSQS
uniref:FAR1 domain-containing protein n=1 Tax=Ananas comosus var. bracteatus TaxID=296719 RepID=A0A6V7Q9D4_ANACO|nr:unnamed protein product [Ananas comosus var. bracteatus]